MKTQKILLSIWLCFSLTGCPSGGSGGSTAAAPSTGGGGTGGGGSGGGSGGGGSGGGSGPADPSLAVQVQASNQTGGAYAVVSVSLQKMLVYTGSGFAWMDQAGTQTALTLSGFDFAHFQNIGLSAAGDLVYGISCQATCLVSRYGTDGSVDMSFSPITFSYDINRPPPNILGEDATYIYFNATQAITNGSSLNISRYVKASGAMDAAFGTAGVATVQDTYQAGAPTPLYLDTPRMTIANGSLYFQAVSQVGRYLFVLSQTDGSRTATPAYFGGYQPWQILGNNAAGNFRNSMSDTQGSYFSSYANNSGNIVVHSDGTLLSFEGPLVVAANADYSVNTTYANSESVSAAVPYGLDLQFFAGTVNVRTIDAFQLPSGHDLIVYGVSANAAGTAQQICAVIVDSTGTPITLTAPGTQPVCQAANWNSAGGYSIPDLSMVPNSDGSTHIVGVNGAAATYTYLLNGTTLQAVTFTIEE